MNYLEERKEKILQIEEEELLPIQAQITEINKQFDYYLYKFATESYKTAYVGDYIEKYEEIFEKIAKKTEQELTRHIKNIINKYKAISYNEPKDMPRFEIFSVFIVLKSYADQLLMLLKNKEVEAKKIDAFLNIFTN